MTNSPAQRAGVTTGDVIIAFNDETVETSGELPPLVGRVRPGTEARITVIRNGGEKVIKVTIDELPENPRQQAAKPVVEPNRLKITVAELDADNAGSGTGVQVTEVKEGPASDAAIQVDDIIVSLNNQAISSVEEFNKVVAGLPANKPIPVLVRRGEGSLFLALTLP